MTLNFSKIFLITVFLGLNSFAYIPPLKMILTRTAENSGSGLYNIELEVTFSDGSQESTVKEIWNVENERTMRVSVQGQKDLKGLNLNYLYLAGQRWAKKNQSKEQTKVSEDFIERWQHFRNSELLQTALVAQGFIPEDAFNKKDSKPKSVNEDSFLKIARTQGTVAYSIGDNKKNDPQSPRFWIEQDFFMIRKLRLTSGAELFMDNYKSFVKNLHYPRERTLKWGNNTVTIKTLTVLAKAGNPAQLFSQQFLDSNNQSDILYNHPLKNQIEEFYTRFR
jgi:hypothetical protein